MALNPADIASVSRLLDDALALDPAERETWLAALPADHQRHVETLRSMLEQQARLDSDPRLASMPKMANDETVAHANDRVGPYRLLHEIGRGGMGSVWLAERADGAYKRQVALKLPRLAWGAGLAERMAHEREIGMLLEHPNIARLYDAGVDEGGRPYLALEFVGGQPIDAWCEAQGLSVLERLRLFVQVVKAVAYAHGRLVVHRDLKPSNVLVTPDGHAHLLDFGIAKLLLEVAPGEPGLTQEQGRVLTPHYAAPEQVAGEAITVQSDVYSLGVLLYELLTGTLPIAPKRGTLGAVEDAILEGDAPLASNRVKDRAVAKALRGEVDAILAKAMQREPARRYVTADALALDIGRHLQGETVSARPDSTAYRLRKAIRRHRVVFTAVGAVILAVTSGAVAALLQAHRAELATRRAIAAVNRAEVVKDFVVDVFRVNAPGNPANAVLRKLPAEALLERGASLIGTRFEREPDLQIEIYGVVASVFKDMTRFDLAEQYARRALDAARASHASAETLARANLNLAKALGNMGRFEEAQQLVTAQDLMAASSVELTFDSHLFLAELSLVTGRPAEAQAQALAAQAIIDRHPAANDRMRLDALEFAAAFAMSKASAEVEPLLRTAIDLAHRVDGPSSERAIQFRKSLSTHLWVADRVGEASIEMDAVLTAMRARNGADDADAARAQAEVAAVLFESRQLTFAQAKASAEGSMRILASRTDLPPAIRRQADIELARIYALWGDDGMAYALLSNALPDLREIARGPALPMLYTALVDAASRTGRTREAAGYLQEAMKHVRGQPPSAVARHQIVVAQHLGRQGRYDEAEQALDVLAQPIDEAHTPVSATRARLRLDRGDPQAALHGLKQVASVEGPAGETQQLIRGAALCAAGDVEAGRRLLNGAIQLSAEWSDPHSPDLAHWRAQAGLCALQAGDRSRANELAQLADSALARNSHVHAQFRAPLKRLVQRLRRSARPS